MFIQLCSSANTLYIANKVPNVTINIPLLHIGTSPIIHPKLQKDEKPSGHIMRFLVFYPNTLFSTSIFLVIISQPQWNLLPTKK